MKISLISLIIYNAISKISLISLIIYNAISKISLISLIIYNAVSNIVARLEVIRLCRPKDFP